MAEGWWMAAEGGASLRFLSAWRPVWLTALLVAVVAYYAWQYRLDGRRLSAGRRRILTALRVAVVAGVVLMLLRPALNIFTVEERAPVVALLLDESSSMAYPAARYNPLLDRSTGDTSRWAAARAAAERLLQPTGLAQGRRVVLFTFAGTIREAGDLTPAAGTPPPNAHLHSAFRIPHSALPTEATGPHSHPADALLDVVRRLQGSRIAGIVLISDGRSTASPESGAATLDEAAARLKEAGVPVFTIATGTAEPIRDLALTDLAAPPEVNMDDVLTMRVTIVNHIAPGLELDLTLDENQDPAGEPGAPGAGWTPKVVRRVRLASGRNDVTVSTIAAGPREGERAYRIRAPRFDDEWTYLNNDVSAHVNVVKRTLRCLLIAGTPTVEYHYLWPALVRDPIINVSCWIHDADVNYIQQGNRPIDHLPATVEEWDAYDVVILYDIDPGKFSNEQESGLEQLVRKGGGLFVMAGRTHGLDALLAVRTAKMAAMLPVEIDRNRHPDYEEVHDRPFRAVRTPAGRQHPIFAFDMDLAANDAVWDSFPEFYWAHPTMGVKPHAISLLEAANPEPRATTLQPPASSQGRVPRPVLSGRADDDVRQDPARQGPGGPYRREHTAASLDGAIHQPPAAVPDGEVLMALARYGEGAVFYSGLHSLWRWRFPFENYDHDRFFSQIVRYLGETRLLGAQKQVALQTDRKRYAPGAEAVIALTVFDPALLVQLRNERLLATVTDERGAAFAVPLVPDLGRQAFVGRFTPRRVGDYRVHADHVLAAATSDQRTLFDETTHFDVRLQSLEEVDPTADLEGLARLAAATGGRAYDHTTLARLGELPGLVPADPQLLPHHTEKEIWDSVFFWAGLVALMTVEWVLRKKWSLL